MPETSFRLVNDTIEEFVTGLPHDRSLLSTKPLDQPLLAGGPIRAAIDRCFSYSSVESIMVALENERSNNSTGNDQVVQWADKTLHTLNSRCPTSVEVACRQMQLGLRRSFDDTFQQEHVLASKLIRRHDFQTGVHARLIQKPPISSPTWQPLPEDKKEREEFIDRLFRVDDDDDAAITQSPPSAKSRNDQQQQQQQLYPSNRRLPLFKPTDFMSYHLWSLRSLPRDWDVEHLMKTQPLPADFHEVTHLPWRRPPVAATATTTTTGQNRDSNRRRGSLDEKAESENGEEKDKDEKDDEKNEGKGEEERGITREQIVHYFVRTRNHKVGVREKVLEILRRKTKIIDPTTGQLVDFGKGRCVWNDSLD